MNFNKIIKKQGNLHERELKQAAKRLAKIYKTNTPDKKTKAECVDLRFEYEEAEKKIIKRQDIEIIELKLSFINREIKLLKK